jgi:DNA (cytosine-5)-methyltransferase 1
MKESASFKAFDARGNGGGETVNTITGDHQNRITDYTAVACNNVIVRRLTPLECERLQGYPDGWTDIGEWIDSKGKKHKDADSPRYKALGNSIALPFWQWMAERITRQLVKDGIYHPTMASLFDGIGGFPLAYSRAGCKPVWASEIEEFPIAVTKLRFPEKENEE